MSSPFQLKFMAKNPVKGFTMAELERSTRRAEKKMEENAAILPQIEGPGNPDFESKDPQRFAGDDTHTYGKKDDSPLNAYVSTAGHFQRMQDNIARAFTPTKGAKTKAEKETEFKGETEKVSEKLKETTDKEFKGFKDGEYQIPSISDFQKNQADENIFNKFGQ
jgi:hypothetical protein